MNRKPNVAGILIDVFRVLCSSSPGILATRKHYVVVCRIVATSQVALILTVLPKQNPHSPVESVVNGTRHSWKSLNLCHPRVPQAKVDNAIVTPCHKQAHDCHKNVTTRGGIWRKEFLCVSKIWFCSCLVRREALIQAGNVETRLRHVTYWRIGRLFGFKGKGIDRKNWVTYVITHWRSCNVLRVLLVNYLYLDPRISCEICNWRFDRSRLSLVTEILLRLINRTPSTGLCNRWT